MRLAFCLLPALLLLLLLVVRTRSTELQSGPTQAAALRTWCRPEEQAALLELRTWLHDPPAFQSWNTSTSCCQWRGVQCVSAKDDDDSRRFTQASDGFKVRSISLRGLRLRGSIPASISDLAMLEALDLSGNQISGPVPRQLYYLARLQSLDLSSNNLSGSLDGVQFSPSLRLLNLSDNFFGGRLPSSMPAAAVIDLSMNSFVGELPASVLPCPSVLNVSGNTLTGSALPSSCGEKLEVFVADANNFSGLLHPTSLANLTGLKVLVLSENAIHGSIPEEIGRLGSLEELYLGYNRIEGPVPAAIANCSALRVLSLRNNGLMGGIAHLDFAKLGNLSMLDLSYNRLSGSIPASIAQSSLLSTLSLGKNFFWGQIPDSLGTLQKLETLSLSGNNLSGGLPLSLQDCSSLVSLILSKNSFTQPLPSNITGFSSLQLLAMGNANLSGSVPSWLANCAHLQVLDLSWNRLEGGIPPWLGSLQHLFYVDLSNNSLSGNIPAELSRIRCLQEDDDVDAAGLRPVASTLFVKHKSNSSALQYNQVRAFPPSLILSDNHLTGGIPSSLGGLKKLVALDLSNNKLTGPIPSNLANATDLECLDLSWNRLTGTIPSSLASLTFLAFFNVSFNQLQGPVPSKNQFASLSSSSYLANPGLCGATIDVQCPSYASSGAGAGAAAGGSSGGVPKAAVMGITISISLGLTALFAAMLMLSFSRRRGESSMIIMEQDFKEMSVAQMMGLTVTMFGSPRQKITVAELVKATNDFDPSNIIGCGGFGLVFKARLPDGRLVAIKRLTSEDSGPQMEREFDAELQTLGKISHENLVPLEGYCRLGRDRLLVYTFMENGSLDHWLHERADGMSWRRRLAILIGAAKGLRYLHAYCDPHIIHRDIKSSNILLDGRFVAHVADFGLARLMQPSDTHVTTELVGTLGYIPPEYAQSSVATLRGDVYSFGVLVLEVLTRRRPVDACRRGGVRDLVPWATRMVAEGRGVDILDPLLLPPPQSQSRCVEEMLRILDVARDCVDACPYRRPSIEDVVTRLDAVAVADPCYGVRL